MAEGSVESQDRPIEAWAVRCFGKTPALFLDKARAEAYAAQHRGQLVKLKEVDSE